MKRTYRKKEEATLVLTGNYRKVARMTINMPAQGGKPLLIEVDARKRITLGRLAEHERYIGTIEEGGIIVLTPAEVVPMFTRKRPGPKKGSVKE